MNKIEQIVIELQSKISQLVEENRQLKHHVLELTEQSSEYRKLSEERGQQLKMQQSGSEALTAARLRDNKADSDKMKGRIDELVREIDRCINLLNR